MTEFSDELLDLFTSVLMTSEGVSMPISSDYSLDRNQVKGFGLSGMLGQRTFRCGLEITTGPAGAPELLAMFEGEVSRVDRNVLFGPPRQDGTRFMTRNSGLLLKISPRIEFYRAIYKKSEYPLQPPPPLWVIYEGATPNESILNDGPVNVEAGTVIGSVPTNGSVAIFVLDACSNYLDALNLVLRWKPELNAHPLSAFWDPLAPAIASNQVKCVSSDPLNDGSTDQSYASFSFHETLEDAMNCALDNDIIWLCINDRDVRANLNINNPISLIGQPNTSGKLPTIKPASENLPIVNIAPAGYLELTNSYVDTTLHFPPFTSIEYGIRILGCQIEEGCHPEGGAAIYATHIKNLHIGNCIFRNNYAGPELNSRIGDGGAIKLLYCESVFIENSEFMANSANKGGAIFAQDCSYVVINGKECVFLKALLDYENEIPSFELSYPLPEYLPTSINSNELADKVPALIGKGFSTLFVNNLGGKSGGAICCINSIFHISNVYFAHNQATLVRDDIGYGGAVAVQVFRDDYERFESSITKCVAIKNFSQFGGAFAAVGIFDTTLALHVNPLGGGKIGFRKNVIYGNEAIFLSGGFHLQSGKYIIEDSLIAKNSASRSGGGISCMAATKTRIENSLIVRNRVTRREPAEAPGGGGGLYVSVWPEITLKKNRVIENHSNEDGGGLRATCGSKITISEGNVFKDNEAYRCGGGISIKNAQLIVEYANHFEGNRTVDGGQGHHRGGDGGAIHCAGAKPLTHDINALDDVTKYLKYFIKEYCYAPCTLAGAVLRINGTSSGKIVFKDNSAKGHGGAILVLQETGITTIEGDIKQLIINHAEFDNNSSASQVQFDSRTYTGSTIMIEGLNDSPVENELCNITNSEINLTQGVGIYLVNSNCLQYGDHVQINPTCADTIDVVTLET